LPSSNYAGFAYSAVLAYTAYAFVTVIYAWRTDVLSRWWPLLTHVIDLGSALILVRFTDGSGSPFVAFLLFPLLPATLRWRGRGVVGTALFVLLGFAGIGLQEVMVLHNASFALNTFILRIVSLAVLAVVLGYIGVYEERSRRAIAKVATWTGAATSNDEEFLADMLAHVADTMKAPRVLLMWRPHGAGTMTVVEWAGHRIYTRTEDLAASATILTPQVRDAHFLCTDVDAPAPKVLHTSSSGLRRWRGAPVSITFRRRFSTRSVLSFRLYTSGIAGRLFIFDKRHLGGHELMLGAVVAQQVAGSLEYRCLLQHLRDAAAMEERVRVARDVHDDVLQSMTALSLGLETVGRLMEQAPGEARQWLTDLQGRLGNDQRSLRTAVRGIKRRGAPPPQLAGQLAELAGDIEQEWGLPVKLDLRLRDVTIPESTGHEIGQIVREGMVNAARHAQASSVAVSIRGDKRGVLITIADDGRGFPFHGRYDDADRRRLGVGPAVLSERVEALGGSLAIESTTAGARLDIRVPLG